MVQAHDKFKQEVRTELDELRALITQQGSVSISSGMVVDGSSPSSASPVVSPSSDVAINPSSTSSASNNIPLPSGVDIQTQTLTMLTDSFSKLSSVILDKNTDTKSDWPKLSGDPKKFRAWYMSILAQLSLPSWKELYDSSTNDIVVST
ncbi:MAG: hypothetical protein ACK53Y_27030, partial [bacterium]